MWGYDRVFPVWQVQLEDPCTSATCLSVGWRETEGRRLTSLFRSFRGNKGYTHGLIYGHTHGAEKLVHSIVELDSSKLNPSSVTMSCATFSDQICIGRITEGNCHEVGVGTIWNRDLFLVSALRITRATRSVIVEASS